MPAGRPLRSRGFGQLDHQQAVAVQLGGRQVEGDSALALPARRRPCRRASSAAPRSSPCARIRTRRGQFGRGARRADPVGPPAGGHLVQVDHDGDPGRAAGAAHLEADRAVVAGDPADDAGAADHLVDDADAVVLAAFDARTGSSMTGGATSWSVRNQAPIMSRKSVRVSNGSCRVHIRSTAAKSGSPSALDLPEVARMGGEQQVGRPHVPRRHQAGHHVRRCGRARATAGRGTCSAVTSSGGVRGSGPRRAPASTRPGRRRPLTTRTRSTPTSRPGSPGCRTPASRC